ncbi:MAG: hypothetical protein IKA47_01050 [Oscillospiraceae bacterium]|nr:hypothetical protein [Oscillospiraceae bacterium]
MELTIQNGGMYYPGNWIIVKNAVYTKRLSSGNVYGPNYNAHWQTIWITGRAINDRPYIKVGRGFPLGGFSKKT